LKYDYKTKIMCFLNRITVQIIRKANYSADIIYYLK